jgi:cytochrome P450
LSAPSTLNLLENQDTLALTFDQTACFTDSIFGAGSDTTTHTISAGILAATYFPDLARKIREELESGADVVCDEDG